MSNDYAKFNQVDAGFVQKFNTTATDLFIAPGRVEIIGNHTDHQHGKTLSMTIDRYIYAAVAKSDDFRVVSYNKGYPDALVVNLDDLAIKEHEYSSSFALVRGVASYFVEHGYKVGGFNIYSLSSIPRGMGLSSSAAFEVLIAQVFNYYFNDGKLDDLFIAKASQFAEQVYFNKPCGLLDQMSISYGGVVYCDFNRPLPVEANLTKISADLHFYVINTGKSHAKLTSHYTLITEDLAKISAYFGHKYLIDVDEQNFRENYAKLKQKFGLRPVNRAIHIFEENRRVIDTFASLTSGDNDRFIDNIRRSGMSSRDLLKNLTYPGDDDKMLIKSFDKVYTKTPFGVRVNGGGFAGTIIVMSKSADDLDVLKKIFHKSQVKILPVGLAKFKAGHVQKLK